MAIATTTLLASALIFNAATTAAGALNKPPTPKVPEDPNIKAAEGQRKKAREAGMATAAQQKAASLGTRSGTLLTGAGGVSGSTSTTERKTLLGY